jgi:hypothetical protein
MQRGDYPSQWVAGLIVMAAGIQGIEIRKLTRIAGVSRRKFRAVLAGEETLTVDEAYALCSALGFTCSVIVEMTLTEAHKRLMAVGMAVEPPPSSPATRPRAA